MQLSIASVTPTVNTIIAAWIVCIFVSRALGEESPTDARAPLATTNIPWSTIKTANFTIYYHKDFAADAQRAQDYLDRTIESLTQEFADYAPVKILEKIDCHVYLYPEPNQMAYDGRSVCITRGLEDGRRHAELHFLTHALYRQDSLDSVGESKAASHHRYRYIVHEYSSIWLGVIARGKDKGWYVNGKDAPNWFSQGYQEYLGMTLSSSHSRTVTFSKYMAAVKQDPDSVLLARGHKDKTPRIIVQRDYTDGFALLAFMHERFGRKAVQSILASEQETFWQAMNDAVQMSPDRFYDEYQAWVKEWKPSDQTAR